MSILKNALNRIRCFIGRHTTYVAETWFFRTMTVYVRPCEHCKKVVATAEPVKRNQPHNA